MRTPGLLLAALLIAACGQDRNDTASAAPQAASAAPAAPAARAGTLVASDANGQPALVVQLDGGHVEVGLAGGERLVGEQKGDKRRWRRASDGRAVAEVKARDDDFKLRTPDGALLWKVKLSDDKIRISDNEENERPFVLKTRYDDKAKALAQDESELGEVRFYADRSKVKDGGGAERYAIDGARRSAA